MTKADWELEVESWAHDDFYGIPEYAPPAPNDMDPKSREQKALDRDLYYNPSRPGYWWVRYYHFIKHHSGGELVENICRLFATVHRNGGQDAHEIWNTWLWGRTTTPHRGVTITTYRGEHDGAKVIHIDTDDTTGHVRVNLNDGPPLFDGDPEETSTTK